MNEKLQDKLSRLPQDSGVYIMKDARGKVIYVGKAVVLKNRVRQYFFQTQKIEKVAQMVTEIDDFEYIITKSEFDALTLEATLVKKYWPKFNILLKDGKTAPYIKVHAKETYPRFEIIRRLKNDGSKYFGPYFFGIRASDILSILKVAYGVRTCNKSMDKPFRECLDYHIKRCLGPCNRKCSLQEYTNATPARRKELDKERNCSIQEYSEAVQNAMAFLSGREDSAKKLLEISMQTAVEQEDFERAILYRDKLAMIDNLTRKNIADLGKIINIDIIAIATDGGYSVVSILFVRNGKLMGAKNYNFVNANIEITDAINSFATQFYMNNYDTPDEIVTSIPLSSDMAEYIYSYSKRRPEFILPKRGVKYQLLQTAQKNADDFLIKSRTKEEVKHSMTKEAVAQLEQILGIKSARRMECYDISHTSGIDTVASQVVFIDGEPAKKEYRKYKIRTAEGEPDDFASMTETLQRRLHRAKQNDTKFSDLPDLIVIDGGKGQLSSAIHSLDEAGFDYIDIVSLAKKDEEIFIRGKSEPITIPHSHNALKLMQRIRDEAHRFAITFNRTLRAKRFLPNEKDKMPKKERKTKNASNSQ